MARTIYGAELYKVPTMEANYASDGLGTNSAEFTAGDPVDVSAGLLAVAGTTEAVTGIAVKSETMAADNQTVDKIYPKYIPIDQDMEFLMGTNADLTATTSVGVYYKLTTATTGAVQVDVTSGAQTTTNRVVVCTKVDPLNEGGSGAGSGLRQGLFKFVKITNFKD